jgi:integrase
MPRLVHKLPAYRRHKKSGQAVVTLGGQDFYLGPWKSAASKSEYKRVTREWLASGGAMLAADRQDELTVVELLAAFKRFAKTYYVDAAGKPNTEYKNYATLIKRLGSAYGRIGAAEFGPLKLKAFRQSLIDEGHSRIHINHSTNRIRHVFKWAVENELVPARIVEALRCVAGLRYGRSDAKETEPVKPVPDAHVDATLPYVARQVAAMLELQRVTGMRSGEVCQMRTRDISTSGNVWTYTPERHKTQYRGHVRTVYLGPKAQDILRPWLRMNLDEHLFQPREAEAERRTRQHAARKTPLSCGNRPGSNVATKPRKSAGDAYKTDSYLRAVKYGIDKANRERAKQELSEIPNWHPHQLRHNAATYFRREHGLEVARVLLGHKHAAITEVYAEADRERAVEDVAKSG